MWIGDTIPALYSEWVDGWKRTHPEWDHRMWDETNLPPLTNRRLWDQAKTIAPEAPLQFRSDVARYELLHQYGGVWLDADFRCLRPIDDLMGGPWAVREGEWLANGAIAVPAQHPLMAELIEGLPANVAAYRKKPRITNTHRSGPRYFTPLARRHGLRELDQHLFLPYLSNRLDRHGEPFPDSYAEHHWHNRRRRQGMKI